MKKESGTLLLEESRSILTVSELNQLVKGTLERELDSFWVVGEISNFRVPPSGHCYFTLKDNNSQLSAVMFRSYARGLGFQPENGMEVLCFGSVSLYPARGDLQLYVESVEPRGQGALYLAFEQLKKRLWEEGLFDEERKKAAAGFTPLHWDRDLAPGRCTPRHAADIGGSVPGAKDRHSAGQGPGGGGCAGDCRGNSRYR